jgi:hypothetical protein
MNVSNGGSDLEEIRSVGKTDHELHDRIDPI